MNLIKKSIFAILSFSAMAFLTSCKEDLSPVGSNIINNPNFEFDLYEDGSIKAYSKLVGPVQSNDFRLNDRTLNLVNDRLLGVYYNPVTGTTEANIITQLSMETPNPSFGDNPEIEKIILSIPYRSTRTGTDEDVPIFRIDSLYGNNDPIKLSIYESNFLLREFDPNSNFEERQKYFSDQGPLFESFLGQLIFQDPAFKPSNEAIRIVTTEADEDEGVEEEIEYLTPRLRVEFDSENHPDIINFFHQKIIAQEGTDELLNNTNFRNHFRGLYLKAESTTNGGGMLLLDVPSASIELIYTKDAATNDEEDDEEERVEGSFKLNFGGVIANTFTNNLPPQLQQALMFPNTNGAENLYIKGGAGAVTVIEIFNPEQLEWLRSKRWIINEANIIVHVNRNLVGNEADEPDRLFLYDLNNNRVLVDYDFDRETQVSDLINYKSSHLGRLQRNSNGDYYRFRITNHVSNLINKDSTNVKLALVASPNVNVIANQSLRNVMAPGIEKFPTSNLLTPKSTVLHGNDPTNPEKSIKLNIYYTKIND